MALTFQDKINMMALGREPNEEDPPYRGAPIPNPGKPPWPGYPKPYEPKLAGGIDLGGGRSLEAAEIRLLREIYPSASEKEKDRLIKMYGNKWMQSDAAAGTKVINELPRGGWPARNSHRGLVDDDKLLDTMRRATAAFKA